MSKHSVEEPDQVDMAFMKRCTGMAEPFFNFFKKVSHYCTSISYAALPKCYIGFLSNINIIFTLFHTKNVFFSPKSFNTLPSLQLKNCDRQTDTHKWPLLGLTFAVVNPFSFAFFFWLAQKQKKSVILISHWYAHSRFSHAQNNLNLWESKFNRPDGMHEKTISHVYLNFDLNKLAIIQSSYIPLKSIMAELLQLICIT